MRLIDADALIEKMLWCGSHYKDDGIRHGYHNCELLVYDAPTIDASVLTEKLIIQITKSELSTEDKFKLIDFVSNLTDFCSFGERKTD